MKIINYHGETITKEDFGYTVFAYGEEIFFETLKEAKDFIDTELNQ